MKLSISVPDDVAAYLQSHGNASAAVRRVLPEARRASQRAAAEAFGAHLRVRGDHQTGADTGLLEASNDVALHGSEW